MHDDIEDQMEAEERRQSARDERKRKLGDQIWQPVLSEFKAQTPVPTVAMRITLLTARCWKCGEEFQYRQVHTDDSGDRDRYAINEMTYLEVNRRCSDYFTAEELKAMPNGGKFTYYYCEQCAWDLSWGCAPSECPCAVQECPKYEQRCLREEARYEQEDY